MGAPQQLSVVGDAEHVGYPLLGVSMVDFARR